MHRKPTVVIATAAWLASASAASASTHSQGWIVDTGGDCAISDTVGRDTMRVTADGSEPGLVLVFMTPKETTSSGETAGPGMTLYKTELSDGIGSPERPIGRDLLDDLRLAEQHVDIDFHVELADIDREEPNASWDPDHAGLLAALKILEACMERHGISVTP